MTQTAALVALSAPERDSDASAAPQLISPQLAQTIARAAAYAKAARAPATLRAYASDWRIFCAWATRHGLTPLPCSADLVATFAAHDAEQGSNPRTIERRIAAIGHYHAQAGQLAPNKGDTAGLLNEVLAGIRAIHGRPKRRLTPARADALAAMLATLDRDDLRSLRDRAILALGMAAALRRSEIVALDVRDIEMVAEGLILTIRRSKTDQVGDGVTIAVPEGQFIEPKAHLRAWLDAAGHSEGPLFCRLTHNNTPCPTPMSDKAVARLIKACAARAGLDPALYSGHSLRSGFLTEAAANKATIFKMQAVSRHKTLDVLATYVRDADAFTDHAGSGFL